MDSAPGLRVSVPEGGSAASLVGRTSCLEREDHWDRIRADTRPSSF